MKVLFVHPNNNYTGQEISLIERIVGLQKHGVECEVLLPGDGQFCQKLQEAKIPVHQITLSRFNRTNPIAFMQSIRVLSNLVAKQKISIIHCSGVYSHQLALWVSRVTKVPCVASVSTTVYTSYDYNKNLVQHTDCVFCVSEVVRRSLLKNCDLPECKAVTLYDGYKLDDIVIKKAVIQDFRSKFNLSENDFVVAVIGEFIPRKGMEYFVSMASILKEKHANMKFFIIGKHHGDAYEERVRRQIKRLGLEEDLIIAGFFTDIYSIISQINVVVVSSLAEGLCRVIVEAQHMKKPVVSTDVSGNVEAIVEGKTGLIVPPERPDLLADRVSHVYQHPKEAIQIGVNAHVSVKEKFTLDMHVQNLINKYQELLTRKKSEK